MMHLNTNISAINDDWLSIARLINPFK